MTDPLLFLAKPIYAKSYSYMRGFIFATCAMSACFVVSQTLSTSAKLLINKKNLQSHNVSPGDFLSFSCEGYSEGEQVEVRDVSTNMIIYDGPCSDLSFGAFALRTKVQTFKTVFYNRNSKSDPKYVSVKLDFNSDPLYPGVLVRLIRRDRSTPTLPNETFFNPLSKVKRANWVKEKYQKYPPFREAADSTALSIKTPHFQPNRYFHTVIPSMTVTSANNFGSKSYAVKSKADGAKSGATLKNQMRYPLQDLAGSVPVSASFSGYLLINKQGQYTLSLDSNLQGRLVVGDSKEKMVSPEASGVIDIELSVGVVPFEFTIDRMADGPIPQIQWQWKPPDSKTLTEIPASQFAHKVSRVMDTALETIFRDSGIRDEKIAFTYNDIKFSNIKTNDANEAKYIASNRQIYFETVNEGLNAFMKGQHLQGNIGIARMIMKITNERIAFLREHTEDIGSKKNAETDGALILLFQNRLSRFLLLCEHIPPLQKEVLICKANMASFITATCFSRPFFSELKYYPNTGYNDSDGFAENVWRAAFASCDPYMLDSAALLLDNTFRYSYSLEEGLSADGVFTFNNLNGRQINSFGYGKDWYYGSFSSGAARVGTPWGYPPKVYHRFFLYTKASEWMIYKNRKPFSSSGSYTSRTLDSIKILPAVAARRMLMLPSKTLYDEDLTEIEKMTERSKKKPENTIQGNCFFFRNLFMVHRRENFYIDVKMTGGMSGGIDTNEGSFPWDMSFSDGVTTLMRDGREYDNIHRVSANPAYASIKAWDADKGIFADSFKPRSGIYTFNGNSEKKHETQQDENTFALWHYRSLPGSISLNDELYAPDDYRSGEGPNAGGVSDDRFGSCGFFYKNAKLGSQHASFYAFLDDGMVRLASDIKSTRKDLPNDVSTRTNINQCDWKSDVVLIQEDGKKETYPITGLDVHIELNLNQRYWVLHNNIGYLIMPTNNEAGKDKPGTLILDLVTRTPLSPVPGWAATKSFETAVSKNKLNERTAKVFYLSIDNGKDVQDGKIAYAVCMSDADKKGSIWLKQPPITILSNSFGVQAIKDLSQGIVHAYFRESGRLSDSEGHLIASSPSPIFMLWNSKAKSLFVQDPQAVMPNTSLWLDEFKGTLGAGLDVRISKNIEVSVPMSGASLPDDRYRGMVSKKSIQF